MLIIVALIAYASIGRPVLNDDALDVHVMWVWQVFTTLLVVVPSWVPGWRELALTTCFAIGCLDTSELSRYVRDVIFPRLRRQAQRTQATWREEDVPLEE